MHENHLHARMYVCACFHNSLHQAEKIVYLGHFLRWTIGTIFDYKCGHRQIMFGLVWYR